MSEAEGVTSLEKLGFGVGKNEGYDEYIKAGDIITQSPKIKDPHCLSHQEKDNAADKDCGDHRQNGRDPFHLRFIVIPFLIFTESPKAGEKAPNGATVSITISLGPDKQMVRVPDLMGRDEEEAMAVLVEAGLQLGTVSEVNIP